MAWFTDWWNTLSLLQQCFAILAIPATVILFMQTLLLLFGIGGHGADHGESDHDFDHDTDSDHDFGHSFDHDTDTDHDFGHGFDHDTDADHDTGHVFDHGHDTHHDGAHHASGLRLFTLRGIVAMFAVGGWLGIAMCDVGIPSAFSVLIALAGGFAALFIAAFVIAYSLKMQESGNISVKNSIAHNATVYIPIPAARGGYGKVTMTLQERFVELEAITDDTAPIPTGTQVQVMSVTPTGEVIVRRLVK